MNLSALRNEYDIIVAGGGVTGAGFALTTAARGAGVTAGGTGGLLD